MMAVKHTKGEWHAVGFMIEVADDSAPDIATFNHAVFDQGGLHRSAAEIMANVKLAAAAPRLLNATKLAIETLAPHKNDDFAWAAITQLQAAINAATGEA